LIVATGGSFTGGLVVVYGTLERQYDAGDSRTLLLGFPRTSAAREMAPSMVFGFAHVTGTGTMTVSGNAGFGAFMARDRSRPPGPVCSISATSR